MRQEELASAEFGQRVAASELRLAQAALARLGARLPGAVARARAGARPGASGAAGERRRGAAGHAPAGDRATRTRSRWWWTSSPPMRWSIQPGAPVRIERWGGDSALAGHVHRVEPSAFTRLSALGVEEQRVNVIIDLDGPQRGGRPAGRWLPGRGQHRGMGGRDRLLSRPEPCSARAMAGRPTWPRMAGRGSAWSRRPTQRIRGRGVGRARSGRAGGVVSDGQCRRWGTRVKGGLGARRREMGGAIRRPGAYVLLSRCCTTWTRRALFSRSMCPHRTAGAPVER